MLGDITAPEPRSKKASEAMFLRRSQRLWVCPTKVPCAIVVTVRATATTELKQSWLGVSQSLSLVLYNPIMFPVKSLSKSSSTESQAVARSGGPP